MMQLGLIGFPIEHSLSPDLYHGFMEVSEINGSYNLFPDEYHHAKGTKTSFYKT
jgi:shikimate 5-dehydrogenase